MGIYLNSASPLKKFKELLNEKYFVDKSSIIEKLNNQISTKGKYICITKPRRFGKTSITDMLGAYYTKNLNTKDIFDKLNISKYENYEKHLNKYNVINISFNDIPENMRSYDDYIGNIKKYLKEDLLELYGDKLKDTDDLFKMFEKIQEQFIFIIDEWDYIFSHNLFEENQKDFLEFLRTLLKDKEYVALCYMTGVLPIKKYSTGSALNMFDEYTFLKDRLYAKYFGFTEEEVINLCKKNKQIKYKELEEWYNGYITPNGLKIYNPRSVAIALKNGYCENYWTSTGAMDEVLFYLKYNIADVKNDVIEMVAGNFIDITIDEEYRAGQREPRTKEEIYSAMIIYGFLSYYEGRIKIPNKELMKEFEKALKDESFGDVMQMVKKSETTLKATLKEDSETVSKVIDEIHNSEIPILKYNDENSLSCVITLAYLYARNYYRIEREEKTGKGYADFMFHPRRKGDTAFILELKVNDTPENALKQIKEKKYSQKFIKENEDRKILAVAICYNKADKKHKCKIEQI
ncbi:MAG: AAA family ATPase [Clostridium sp.]